MARSQRGSEKGLLKCPILATLKRKVRRVGIGYGKKEKAGEREPEKK